MPSRVRQVGFASIPATYSRLPRDDELFVMKAFANHCSHCDQCAHPYENHLRSKPLCSKGHQRAVDVAQYLFNKAGKAFSVVDLNGNKRMQVEIPVDCAVVRDLLKAMERGLRLRRDPPLKSYDETYYVPSRRPQREYEYREPKYLPRKLEVVERRPSSYYPATRDYVPAPKYVTRQPTYYTVGSKGALPLPARGDDWH